MYRSVHLWNSAKVPRQHSESAPWPPPQLPHLSETTHKNTQTCTHTLTHKRWNPKSEQWPLEIPLIAVVCRYWSTIIRPLSSNTLSHQFCVWWFNFTRFALYLFNFKATYCARNLPFDYETLSLSVRPFKASRPWLFASSDSIKATFSLNQYVYFCMWVETPWWGSSFAYSLWKSVFCCYFNWIYRQVLCRSS